MALVATQKRVPGLGARGRPAGRTCVGDDRVCREQPRKGGSAERERRPTDSGSRAERDGTRLWVEAHGRRAPRATRNEPRKGGQGESSKGRDVSEYGEKPAVRLAVLGAKSTTKKSEKVEGRPVKWWPPYLCRVCGSILIGKQVKGDRCKSRGCLECHRRSLGKYLLPATDVVRQEGERMYAVVLAPPPVRTREDVATFLSSVRGMMRDWEQQYGLGASWWVAEVVEKVDDPAFPRTEIPCPVRTYEPSAEEYARMPKDVAAELRAMHRDCGEGGECHLCDGTGYLPGVHLHVHVAVVCRAFWFGTGESPPPPSGADKWEDFGGLGWGGFVKKHEVGVGRVEPLRTRGGLGGYLTKACLHYMSKSSGQRVGHGAKDREQDWASSQRGAELAQAVYGTERAREKNGRAQGLGRRCRDAALVVQRRPGHRPDRAEVGLGPAMATRRKSYQEQRRREALEKVVSQVVEDHEPAPVELLTVGRRGAARGDYGEELAWESRAPTKAVRAHQATQHEMERQAHWRERQRYWGDRIARARKDSARQRYMEKLTSAEDRAQRAGQRAELHRERAEYYRRACGGASWEELTQVAAAQQEREAEQAPGLAGAGEPGMDGQPKTGVQSYDEIAAVQQAMALLAKQIAERGGHEVLKGTEVAGATVSPDAERRVSRPLKDREVSGPEEPGEAPESPEEPVVLTWSDTGELVGPAQELYGARALAEQWQGVPWVHEEQWWTCEAHGGLLVGRGPVLTHVQGADAFDAPHIVLLAQLMRRCAEARRQQTGQGERWRAEIESTWMVETSEWKASRIPIPKE